MRSIDLRGALPQYALLPFIPQALFFSHPQAFFQALRDTLPPDSRVYIDSLYGKEYDAFFEGLSTDRIEGASVAILSVESLSSHDVKDTIAKLLAAHPHTLIVLDQRGYNDPDSAMDHLNLILLYSYARAHTPFVAHGAKLEAMAGDTIPDTPNPSLLQAEITKNQTLYAILCVKLKNLLAEYHIPAKLYYPGYALIEGNAAKSLHEALKAHNVHTHYRASRLSFFTPQTPEAWHQLRLGLLHDEA